MKLTITLSSQAIDILKRRRGEIATARGFMNTFVRERELLQEAAAALPAEIIILETKAGGGLDAEAAIALAGKREQSRLLAARIENMDRAGSRDNFQRLHAALRGASDIINQVGRAEAESHLGQIVDAIEPFFAGRAWAAQHARQIPSYQYLLNTFSDVRFGQVDSWESLLPLADKLEEQIEAMLNGDDFLPSLKEMEEARERQEKINAAARARSLERQEQVRAQFGPVAV